MIKYLVLIFAIVLLIDGITLLISSEVETYSILGFEVSKTAKTVYNLILSILLLLSALKDFRKKELDKEELGS